MKLILYSNHETSFASKVFQDIYLFSKIYFFSNIYLIGFLSQESKPIDPPQIMSAENTWIIISFCFFQLLCPVFGGFEKVRTCTQLKQFVSELHTCRHTKQRNKMRAKNDEQCNNMQCPFFAKFVGVGVGGQGYIVNKWTLCKRTLPAVV